MKKTTTKFMNYAAILSVFFFSGAGTFVNAAVQTMIEAWPQLPVTMVRLVTSLPCLISLPVALLAGQFAGKKLSFRFCAIAGSILILGGGIAPFFFSRNWILILIFRSLLGIGVGLAGMRNALIIKAVPEDEVTMMVGYGSGAMNAGGMIAGPIAGLLAAISWKTPFLYNLLAVIPLLLTTFCLREPEAENPVPEIEHLEKKSKENSQAWKVPVYIVLQFLTTMGLYPLLSGMSSYMTANHLGSSFWAGISNFSYCFAGVLVNVVLDRILRRLKQYAMPVMCLIFAAGMACVVFLPAIPTILAGAVLAGIGFNAMMSLFQLYNGKVCDPAKVGVTSTVIITMLNLGNFMSVFYINACDTLFHMGNDIRSSYFGSMLLYLAIAVFTLLIKTAPEEEYERRQRGES